MSSLRKRLERARTPRGIRHLAWDISAPLWDRPERDLAETLLISLLAYLHDFERDKADWLRLLELVSSAADPGRDSRLAELMRSVGKHSRSSVAYAYWLTFSTCSRAEQRKAAFLLMRVLLRRCEKDCRLFELDEVTLADLWVHGFPDGDSD